VTARNLTEQPSGMLRCVECAATSKDGIGWGAYLVGDEAAEDEEVGGYCPACAARRSAGREPSKAHMPLSTLRLFLLAVSVFALAGSLAGQRVQAGSVIGVEGKPATGLIAFSAGPHPHEDVYVVSPDGSGLRRLTDDPGADFDPSWSPDGRRIAYRHEGGGGDASAEIYVMNANGSQKHNLTRRPGQDHSPAWSPDGRRIAFASVRGGPMPRIWVMNADGSKQRRVTRVSGEYPAWSADGRKIAFDGNTFGATGWDIWVVNADGFQPRPLIASRADEQGAAWSPNGRTIAYGSNRGAPPGYKRIWLADANGSGQHPTHKTSWRPPGLVKERERAGLHGWSNFRGAPRRVPPEVHPRSGSR
jgi:dipeptidyl aminopeptidase/acylaminoacyl peptidase